MIETLIQIEDILDSDEVIVSYLKCSLRTFTDREIYKPGVIVSTNKKVLFYGFKLGDIKFIEKYPYKEISFIQEKEDILKSSIVMYCNNESIKVSNILSENINEFINIVKEKISM